MAPSFTLFLSAFSTLLALVNPLEALSVFVGLTEKSDDATRQSLARRSCLYALLLMLFFLVFGTLILRVFGVPLSMVRMAGGLILMKIGFNLFSGPAADVMGPPPKDSTQTVADMAFVPFAMPIMFGPGGIATIIGMTSLVKTSKDEFLAFFAIVAAIVLTMAITYLALVRAKKILNRVGPHGVDAVSRIIGFFVATMGVSLLFDGTIEALRSVGLIH